MMKLLIPVTGVQAWKYKKYENWVYKNAKVTNIMGCGIIL